MSLLYHDALHIVTQNDAYHAVNGIWRWLTISVISYIAVIGFRGDWQVSPPLTSEEWEEEWQEHWRKHWEERRKEGADFASRAGRYMLMRRRD